MILYFALDDFWLFFKGKHPCKNSCRIDPEGGHMFIEELIGALLSTLKAVVCDNSNTFDRLRGRLVGNIPYYKHTTAFGVEKQKSFNRTLVTTIIIHLAITSAKQKCPMKLRKCG